MGARSESRGLAIVVSVNWNYLYLSQKLDEARDLTAQEHLRQAIASGSVVAWQHINLLGEYDFSEERLQDSVGINLPQLLATPDS